MSEWKECKLGEIIKFKTGKLNSNAAVENGVYPFFTCSPETLRIDNYAFDEDAILLAGNNANGDFCIKRYNGKFNAYQRTYIITSDMVNLDFMFYALKLELLQFKHISAGTATRFLTAEILKMFPINIPPFIYQCAIAEVLSSLDDKIDLLHRQNKTLEAMAEALFRQRFVEDAAITTIKIGDVIEIHDSKRIPLSSTERDKMKSGILYPYYGAATIMDYINTYIFEGEYLLFGEDGTVQTEDGFPILQLTDGKFWVNNHTHVINAKYPYSNFLLYSILKKTSISHIVTGAVQPKINQENLKSLEINVPTEEEIKIVVNETNCIWRKMQSNNKHIKLLEKLRDTLLPKLMSGEVRVGA